MLGLAAAVPLPVRAQDPTPTTVPAGPVSPFDGRPITELRVIGLERIDEAYVRNQIRTRVGQTYSQTQVQRDIGTLLRTARFLDVRAQPAEVPGGVVVTFSLVEKPEVESVSFVGNVRFKEKKLLEALTFAAGDPLDMFEIRQGREAIERLYREKGYAFAEVTVDEEQVRTGRRVVYTIVENQRVRVRGIRFEGAYAFDATELENAIETKTYIWIFRTGDYDPDKVARDAATLQAYYRDRGFLDAEVSWVPEFRDVAREELDIIFRINEGVRYTVEEIRFEGHEVVTEEELLAAMRLKVGDPLLAAQLNTDVKSIETLYGSRGYIEAQVAAGWVYSAEPERVIVTIRIREGEPFRFGWIEVNGNLKTQEKCVRRELRFFPEDVYDITLTRAAEKRLKETGLFTEARIEPVAPPDNAPGVRDAIVTVTENPQTTQFIAGIGASSDSGLVGNIVLENTNFDILDRPRTWEEFFRGRAFRGAGQTMRLQLEPGTEFTRFRIDFREPYLNDRPIGFNTSLYLFERGRDGYDEQRAGFTFSFDHKFEKGFLKDWIGEIAFRNEYVNVADRESFAAKDIRDAEGGHYLSSIKLSLAHDTTDSRFNPTEGHRFVTSVEQFGMMGGDYFFTEFMARYIQHWTVAIDEQDRRSVVSWHATLGQMFGDTPVFERFYAGGIGSFRGFDYRGISPRDGLRRNRIGGDFMVLTGAEYTFPIYDKVIRGVFFADMGTVERDFGISSWRAAVGAGIRLTLDIFGTVPMEFDLALPVAKDGEDDTRIFSFFIGLPFL